MNIPLLTMNFIVLPSAEQFFLLLAFMFPPVLILVLTVILLACVGKSIGIRERYVQTLLQIFEWGSGEIQFAFHQHKLFVTGDEELEEDDTQSLQDNESSCSSGFEDACSDTRTVISDSENGLSNPKNGISSGLKNRTASTQSKCSYK